MKDWKIKLDCVFVVSLAVTATIALCSCKSAEVAEPTSEPTISATIAETTEAVTEPTETEPTVTEGTEPLEPTTETRPQETLQPITLYDVPLGVKLQLHIIETAKVNGIDPAILFAIACRESSYRPNAIGDGGASLGLMQVQPRWHSKRMERLGCTDLLDPFQNVTVAVDYLVELLTRYSTIDKALVAYNRGHYNGTITEYAVAVMNIAEEVRSTKYQKEVAK